MSGHAFVRPGQVAPDRPAPDQCMVCGDPEAGHAGLAGTAAAGVRLGNLAGLLGSALARWAERDPATGATADQIRAGHESVATVDDMMAALHKVRGQLVGELRAEQDANAARVDAMLAEYRDREAGR